MRTLKIAMICAFALLGMPAFAGEYKTSVECLSGEKWWGGFTALGRELPLAENTKWFDLSTTCMGNQSAPLLVSSKGRYVWSDKPFKFRMDGGTLKIESDFEKVPVSSAGKTLKDAYLAASNKFFPPDGKIPPEIFFNRPQYNTWIDMVRDQTQDGALAYAEGIVKNNFPTGMFMVDGGWERYYGFFQFRADKFPNPKKLNETLHGMGFKVIYWIGPFVAPAGGEFLDRQAAGLLVADKNGRLLKGGVREAAVIRWWSGFSATFDTTNPKARGYVRAILEKLQKDFDIDGFKFDGGDMHHVVGENLAFGENGRIAADYTYGWAQIGLDFPYNEYRACWKMGGKALVQRLLDKNYSWKDLEKIIPDMISAGLLGHAYTCPDMVGGGDYMSFKNLDRSKLDQRFIVRSAQAHALMPMMQFSLAPWKVLDKKHLDLCRAAANLHVKFGDYILEQARHASKTGEPIVRAMEYEFPNGGFENCKDQFMLGGKYLVAPVTTPADKRSVTLPEGKWRDELGVIYRGGKTVEIDAPIERLPYFERL